MIRRAPILVAAAAVLLTASMARGASASTIMAQGSTYLTCPNGGRYLVSTYAYYGGGAQGVLAVNVYDASGNKVFSINNYVPAPSFSGGNATFTYNGSSVTFSMNSGNIVQGSICVNCNGGSFTRPSGSPGMMYVAIR